ncbi:hypothetical protein HK103_005623 [Boothiomyces macroporosus]|uniref:Phospholipid-transporting ATPase n=1 Tax=Boothiomyces macroporosus TaxID=261099 RepID=A0AAD5Y2M4_9FUNG|nr:hypothetical protein HK103_005623 [Boothiomyces macroporosus]
MGDNISPPPPAYKNQMVENVELQVLKRPSEIQIKEKKNFRKELGNLLRMRKEPKGPYEVKFPKDKHLHKANYIRTTKYTVLTFLPLNLAMQNRYRADKMANTTPVIVIENGQKKTISAQELQPGDIVYIEKGSKFQVDAILLSSSYEDGTAFIETAELDGETNLKRKSTVPTTSDRNSPESISKIGGLIQCEQPNDNLVSFEGRITLDDGKNQTTPLSLLNLVCRGSVLRNTDYVYAIVLYCGGNTKIMKNLKRGKLKTSSLERKLNLLVLAAFAFNAVLLVLSVVLEYQHYQYILGIQNTRPSTDLAVEWYIGLTSSSATFNLWSTIISFFALYTYVIPISLFVTIELVKLGQATYMVWDPKMQSKRTNIDGTVSYIPMRANNSNLNEDLGCVDYIFSDKTGTLTQNVMEMAQFFIDGEVVDEMKNPGTAVELYLNATTEKRKFFVDHFFKALALCHGCIPAIDEKTGKMIFESQSPDETALLEAAMSNKYKLYNRTKQTMSVEIRDKKETFEILTIIEFNSTRKRMSAIIRSPEGIKLYCKGADNIMMARLDPEKNDPELLKKANESLTEFSNVGLRTLVIAYRDLTEEEFDFFKKQYDEAEISLDGREEKIAQASDIVETGLTLLGCTAIEDKLQDRVPETIENLLKADIKLWLLTGDKQETAINIGMSSRLINRDMKLFILSASSPEQCEKEMDKILQEIQTGPSTQIYALVVDGQVLSNVFAGAEKSKSKFLTIGKRCKTVICSRVTPLQKSLVVRLVRKSLKTSITLAIGDGANDVSMIQEAHIGIGIMGKEGTQAVRAADYAFGEFRFLERLLTIHGRFNYLRMANLILYSFYKNFVFISIQLYFGFFSAWSGQIVYEELFLTAFNVIFTSLPPFMYGLFERDLPEKVIEDNPQIYKEVKNGLYWNYAHIARWFVMSMIHPVIIFVSVYLLNSEGALDDQGRSTGYWVQCYLFSTPMLLVVLFKMAIISKFWIWFTAFGLIASYVLNVGLMFCLFLLDYFFYSDSNTAIILHSLPAYYLLIVLLPPFCIIPDLLLE